MLVQTKNFVSSDQIAAIILVESALAPKAKVNELHKAVLHRIRLEHRVGGFTGFTKTVEDIKGYSFLNWANLETCHRVATKLIKWDATGMVDRILQQSQSTSATI